MVHLFTEYRFEMVALVGALFLCVLLAFVFCRQKAKGRKMIYKIASLSNQGNRDTQDDSFGFEEKKDSNELIAVVSDGMGGLQNGYVASRLTVDAVIEKYRDNSVQNPQKLFRYAINQSEINVEKYIQENSVDCGATLISVLMHGDRMYFGSVGDSCIFHIRGNRIERINTFHNYAHFLEERVRRGEIPKEETEKNPLRARLTSYIGIGEGLKAEICRKPLKLEDSDIVMLCSDGVYNALGDDLISDLLNSIPFEAVADKVEQAILNQHIKNQDNFTAVIILCESEK